MIQKIGKYQILNELGKGATSIVYLGMDPFANRKVAVKVVEREVLGDKEHGKRFRKLFLTEASLAGKLSHPHIAAIFDAVADEEGSYIVMEYVEGGTLEQHTKHDSLLPVNKIVEIIFKCCKALDYAHRHGVIHRDIKPANIMLNRRGGEPDVVKVLDFGLVKAIDDEKQAQQSGGMSGTPLYMSPEAIQTPDMVDARSDLYAVGAVGYYLLTGQPVFHAASLVELCQQHVTTTPDSPSQRLGHTVSAELESALLACLEKSRAKRPQTARDFSLLLDRAPTAGSWTIDDAEAWWGRHDRGQPAAGSGSVASNTVSGAAGGTIAATATAAAQSRPAGTSPTTTAVSGFDRTIEPR
jgi:serine/threonine protein kinase